MTASHPERSARAGDCGPKVIDFFRVGLFASSHSSLNWWRENPRISVFSVPPTTGSWVLNIFWFSISCPPGPLL